MPTPSETQKILQKIDAQPRKKLGQNFLIDGNIANKSIEFAKLQPGQTTVEVGPGLGMLTQKLLDAGATVYAVEKDTKMYAYLKDELAPQFPDRLNLLHGDAVASPLANFQPKGTESFKIVANLPYAISTPWLGAILSGPLPQSMTLMVQKEAADRYLAQSRQKSFCPISIFLQSLYSCPHSHKVSRNCFHPPPDIDSSLIHLERKKNGIAFPQKAREHIRHIFTKRRKQIGSIIRSMEDQKKLSEWLEQCAPFGITPQTRPEDIPLEAWWLYQ